MWKIGSLLVTESASVKNVQFLSFLALNLIFVLVLKIKFCLENKKMFNSRFLSQGECIASLNFLESRKLLKRFHSSREATSS